MRVVVMFLTTHEYKLYMFVTLLFITQISSNVLHMQGVLAYSCGKFDAHFLMEKDPSSLMCPSKYFAEVATPVVGKLTPNQQLLIILIAQIKVKLHDPHTHLCDLNTAQNQLSIVCK